MEPDLRLDAGWAMPASAKKWHFIDYQGNSLCNVYRNSTLRNTHTRPPQDQTCRTCLRHFLRHVAF